MRERLVASNSHLRLVVSPELGGCIISFDALIEGDWQPFLRGSHKADHVLNTGCFPMVPFCNRIKNGQFQWGDKNVLLSANHPPEPHALHGFGWQQKWQTEHISQNQILLSHYENGEHWPYHYFACQRFILNRRSLRIEMAVTNHGTEPMPSGLGFHPYFPLTSDVRFQASCNEKWLVDDAMMPMLKVPAPESISSKSGLLLADSNLDNLFEGFDGYGKIIWPNAGVQMEMRASSNCPFLQIYTPTEKDFFCIEPQTMCTDGFNRYQKGLNHTGVAVLKSGETQSIWMELFPRKLAVKMKG